MKRKFGMVMLFGLLEITIAMAGSAIASSTPDLFAVTGRAHATNGIAIDGQPARQVAIQLNTAALEAMAVGEKQALQFSAFDEEPLLLSLSLLRADANGDRVWRGSVAGFPGSIVLITRFSDIVEGQITVMANEQYVLKEDVSGALYLKESSRPPRALDVTGSVTTTKKAQVKSEPVSPVWPWFDNGSTIDILFVINKDVNKHVNPAVVDQTIGLAIEQLNAALANSNVKTLARSAGKIVVERIKDQPWNKDGDPHALSVLLNSISTDSTVWTERVARNADIVVGFGWNIAKKGDGSCASGVPFGDGAPIGVATGIDTSGDFDGNHGFAVVQFDCATANMEYVFAHEVGHVLGLQHPRNQSQSQIQNPAFPFAWGYVQPKSPALLLAPAASLLAPGGIAFTPRILYFSTPTATFNGVPMGDVNNDNARAIGYSAPVVAKYQTSAECQLSSRNYVPPAGAQTSFSFSAEAVEQRIKLPAPPGCWATPVVDATASSWLSIPPSIWPDGSIAKQEPFDGTIGIRLEPNTGATRTGTIQFGTYTVTVTQQEKCTYMVGPGSVAPQSWQIGAVTFDVDTPAHCKWEASTNSPTWMALSPATNVTGPATGPGKLVVNLLANRGSDRVGQVTIAGEQRTITQLQQPCEALFDPATVNFPTTGGTYRLPVSNTAVSGGCWWNAAVSWAYSDWISASVEWPNPAQAGVGDGMVVIKVAPNTRFARTGKVMIGTKLLSIAQAQPACPMEFALGSYNGQAFGSSALTFSAPGGTVGWTLKTLPGCSWSFSTLSAPFYIQNPTGVGSAIVWIGATANNTGGYRYGSGSVNGSTFTLTQYP